jgi:predicted transcriptional regulator
MPRKPSKFSDEQLLELYDQGLTDREIAEGLGVSQAAVNYRRCKLGLKTNFKRTGVGDKIIAALCNEGLTDKEIASVLGVTQSTVNYRRERLGLKSNYVRTKFTDEDFLRLYHEGLPDKEIASILQVTPAAVNYRRERLGLRSNSAVIDMTEFSALYYKGFDMERIADEMSVSLAKVTEARQLIEPNEHHPFARQEGI